MVLEITPHLDEEQFEKYSMGAVSEQESAQFEEHLLICESCRRKVTETDNYIAAMHGASRRMRESEKQEARAPIFPRLIPLFSAAVLIVVVVLVGLRMGNRASLAPPLAVNLVSTRGAGIDAKAPPHRPLMLNLELTGLPLQPSYRVEMVDSLGKVVWNGMAPSNHSVATASVPGNPVGVYFVRIYGSQGAASGELLREYGIDLAK
ncbi:MAG TPA: T9SS type A sorting domain-containing protein [Bryobacteraceae bacterium]